MIPTLNPRRRIVAGITAPASARLPLKHALAEHGIDVVPAGSRSDVHLIDLRQTDEPVLGRLISASAATPRPVPSLYLVCTNQLQSGRVIKLAQSETVVTDAAKGVGIVHAIRRAVNDFEQAAEAALRLRAAALMGDDPLSWPVPARREGSVILLADPGAETLALLNELEVACSAQAALTRGQVIRSLEMGQADGIAIRPGRNRKIAAALVKMIRRHGEASTTPVVVFEDKPGPRHHDLWSRLGADAVLSTSEAGLGAEILKTQIKRRSASRSIRDWLEQDAGSFPVDPLASPRMFETCLSLRLAEAQPRFTLSALRLDADEGPGETEALSEAAAYLSLALRHTDMICRPRPDLFLVTFPYCDALAAQHIMQDLSKMITDLKFGLGECMSNFNAAAHSVAASPGATVEGMVAEALRGIPMQADRTLLPA